MRIRADGLADREKLDDIKPTFALLVFTDE